MYTEDMKPRMPWSRARIIFALLAWVATIYWVAQYFDATRLSNNTSDVSGLSVVVGKFGEAFSVGCGIVCGIIAAVLTLAYHKETALLKLLKAQPTRTSTEIVRPTKRR